MAEGEFIWLPFPNLLATIVAATLLFDEFLEADSADSGLITFFHERSS